MMKDYLKGAVAGFAAVSLIGGTVAIAKNSQETIDAAYQNIKLIVDGVMIDPKDANGNSVEPFIYNGTTYLPVRAVGAAFDKTVVWDGDAATVDLHEPEENPAADVELHDRPYTECGDPNNLRSFEESGIGYIQCTPSSNREKTDSGKYWFDNYVTYPLNGKASYISGEFYISSANDSTEGILKICNSSGQTIYTSPIMRKSTAAVSFNVPVTGEDSVKLVFESTTESSGSGGTMRIKNPIINTTDY